MAWIIYLIIVIVIIAVVWELEKPIKTIEKKKVIRKKKDIMIWNFPKYIKEVYFPFHIGDRRSEYCTHLRTSEHSVRMWSIIPMLQKDWEVAYYKIIKEYYTYWWPDSDRAFWDDGMNRDMRFHHVEKLSKTKPKQSKKTL